MIYDALIIGSGFGGSVAALRLSEKGYRVAVLEQGRRIGKVDMDRAARNPLHLIWAPGFGLRGFFNQVFFRHVNVAGGVGVGGGSLVYAAVLLEPGKAFYNDPAWNDLGVDWEQELRPHYKTASRMMGQVLNPALHTMDEYLKQTAEALQVGETFGTVPLGIYFGKPGVTVRDPYFDGRGPTRTGCIRCGDCLAGCPHNAKNSLDQNYLYLAESHGAVILPLHQATSIRPLPGGGYEVEAVNPLDREQVYKPLRSRWVVLAAGVLGTLTLLFRCRDELKTLPDISPVLGQTVRTNSEAIAGILSPNKSIDLSRGPTVSSHFYLNDYTHVPQHRFPKSYTFMKWYSGPLVDEERPGRRALKTILAFLRHPWQSTASWRARNWHRRISVLIAMQHLDNQVSFRYGRSLFSRFRKRLISVPKSGKRAPAYLREANQVAREFARQSGGIPHNNLLESLFNMSVTAHILGGCQIGKDRETGVIDASHQVYGYPGLFVVDASAIPANLGVNPSLTILALAERCMERIPEKEVTGLIKRDRERTARE